MSSGRDTGAVTTPTRHELQLVPRSGQHSWLDGDVTRRPVSHFLDLVVDGRSLLDLAKGSGNLVTELNRPWLQAVPEAVAVLRGQQPHADLEPGRIALLVCIIDGDLGCGAVTAALQVSAETVTWSDFQWENGYEEPDAAPGMPESFTFDRRQYEQVLDQAVVLAEALPYDELEHRGRRFLWPWQWGWRLPRGDQPG